MTDMYESALHIFNEQMGTSYSVTNPELILITKKTGVALKNAAIDRLHASNHHAESPSDFNYMRAEALIGMDGDKVSGQAAILYREDIHGWEDPQTVLLHELGHVFALTQEYNGKLFYDAIDMENTSLFSGYLIWKEFIADYIARICKGWYPIRLSSYRPTAADKKRFLKQDQRSHDFLSAYLAQAGCAEEIHLWPEKLEDAVEGLPFSRCIQVIAPQLQKERYWEIDEALMADLGEAFIIDKSFLMLDLEYEIMKK